MAGIAGIDYNATVNAYRSSVNARTQGATSASQAVDDGSIMQARGAVEHQEAYASSLGNTCTDGLNDGKVSAGKAAVAVGKGVIVGGLIGMVKGAIQHPFKTALMVGACFIPVVGPFIGAGLAAYGLASSAVNIAKGVKTIQQSNDDSLTLDSYYNIGANAFNGALSFVGLKGSLGALKGQLTGGSTTVKAIREAKASGQSLRPSEIINKGWAETKANASGAWDALKGKVDKAYECYKQIKQDGITETFGNKLDNWWANSRFSKTGRDLRRTQKEAKASAQEKLNNTAEKLKTEYKSKGWKKSGQGYKEVQGNTTTIYDKYGNILSEKTIVNGKTTSVTEYKVINGQSQVVKESTMVDGKLRETYSAKYNKDGALTYEQRTQNNTTTTDKTYYDRKGNQTGTNTEVKTYNDNGKVATSEKTSVNNKTNVTETVKTNSDGTIKSRTNTETGTTYTYRDNKKTTGNTYEGYISNGELQAAYRNGELYRGSELSSAERLGIKIDTSNIGHYIDSPTQFGNLTINNGTARGLSTVVNGVNFLENNKQE